MYEFNEKIVDNHKTVELIEKFKNHFINSSYPERILMVNHLKNIEKVLPVEKLRFINIPRKTDIFLYHERLKTLYLTSFEKIYSYVEQLEPWEDVDCLVFDEEFNWFIGITHNDSILLSGIN